MKRFLAYSLFAALLCGCGGGGGGGGASDNLQPLRAGAVWSYVFDGTVKLPTSLGGGTQSVTPDSTLTYSVLSTNTKDANGDAVLAIDRKFDVTTLDARKFTAHFRDYVSQADLGIYLHGFNSYDGDTFDATKDKFISKNVTPPYKLLYMPNPVAGTVSFPNPFELTGGDKSYTFAVTKTKRLPVIAPFGTYNAMTGTISEKYDGFVMTSVGLVPELEGGIVSANVAATTPGGMVFSGTILLKTYTP